MAEPGRLRRRARCGIPRLTRWAIASALVAALALAPGCAALTESSPPVSEASSVEISSATDAIAVVNVEREASGIRPLLTDDALTALAQRWADGYAADGTAQWEDGFGDQLAGAGFGSGYVAAASGVPADRAVADWLADPEMREVLLDPEYGSVGFAVVPDAAGRVTSVVLVGYRADDSSLPLGSLGAAEALELTNAERARHGLPALTLSADLNIAAQGQADHQAAILTMTHDGNGGLGNRLNEVGYQAGAENVAVGQQSVADVMQAWIDSPGHHANIVHPDMREMGFAAAVGSDGRAYFAQVFGAR